MATPKKTGAEAPLIVRLKKDVEAELLKEIGDDPELIRKIEAAIEKVAGIALDDVVSEIKSPVVRSVVRMVLHRALDAELGAL